MTLDDFHPQTIIEPFRVRSVEPIRFTTLDGARRRCSRRRATTHSCSRPSTC